uniref:Sugar phosphate exchanger 3 n=1 Tax=Tetraodon nigroviridis TaxID=99883 RepID=H3DMF8_TETNG
LAVPVMPPSCCGCLSQYTHHHLVAFLLTFFSYVLLHASRKTFSNVKVSISAQWTPPLYNASGVPVERWNGSALFANEEQATLFLGALDSIFLFSYAAGLYLSGVIGDRVNLRYVLCFGLCGSAAVEFVFGTVTWLRLYNVYLYCSLWVLNGLLQSAVWPCVVAVMGNWFGKSGRGFVFGLWSACAPVGNILGAFLASSVLKYGYEYAFLVTAVVQLAGGVVVFFGLLVSPKEVGLSVSETVLSPMDTDAGSHQPLMSVYARRRPALQQPEEPATRSSQAISFWRAFLLPGVLPYSLAYACLKLVNYSFFFWLPFYLSSNFGWKEAEADRLSVWYDVGGIIGGTVQGLISDVMGKRAPVVIVSLLLAIGALWGYSRSPNDQVVNAVLLANAGCFIGGPSAMISSAISADLGRQEALRGSQEALATVTGIVDGTGSIGAAAGQYLVSLIESKLGWMYVFYFFIVMTAGSIVFIIPLLVGEVRSMLLERRARRHQL